MTKNLVVGPGTSFFICYDVNGLLTNTHDAALHPLPGVREALHILKKENVKAQIAKLVKESLVDLKITASKVLAETGKIAFSNVGDYVDFGKNGISMVNKKDLSIDQMAALSEISEVESASGRTVKFKLHSKVAALGLLGQYFKMWGQKSDAAGASADSDKKPVAELTDAQVSRRLEELKKKIEDPEGPSVPEEVVDLGGGS